MWKRDSCSSFVSLFLSYYLILVLFLHCIVFKLIVAFVLRFVGVLGRVGREDEKDKAEKIVSRRSC